MKFYKCYHFSKGQGQIPTNWIREENHDVIAFFELYPDGKGGVNAKRQIRISKTDFFSTKFLNWNKMYAKNSDYLFVCQQFLERHLLESNVSVAGQKGKIDKRPDGTKLLSVNSAFDIFGKIPGTPQYWKNYRNELFARMEQLGPFHFFFTLSAAEMRWSEVQTAILHYDKKIEKIVYETGWEEDEEKIKLYLRGNAKIQSLKDYKAESRDQHKSYKEHFLLITRIFDNRVKAFISNILMANEDVEHYSYRIEFQVRGLPHLHGFFWLNESKIKNYKVGDEFDDSKIGFLINEFISCSLNTGDKDLDKLVSEVNVHKHTKTCQRGNDCCRFNFPKLPSDYTLIAKPLSEEEQKDPKSQEALSKASEILEKVKTHLADMTNDDLNAKSLKDILKDLNIGHKEYHEALAKSTRGSIVVLERRPNEMWVNNYNPHFLKAWGANMDIQFCMDSYAVITYITDYLTKGDAGLTKELRKALLETKHCDNFSQLNHLKMTYFKNKQVSVAEATYRLIRGLDLKKSNIACTYVTTGFPENRSSFFRPAKPAEKSSDVENLENEEDNEENTNGQISLEGRQGQFKEVETIHKKYSERPESLNNCCLAQFATSYVYIQPNKIPKQIKWDNGSSSEPGLIKEFISKKNLPKYIVLNSGTCMALRNIPLILRIHSSKKKRVHGRCLFRMLVVPSLEGRKYRP